MWVVHGWEGLQEYRRRREEETKRISGFKDGDWFHNGEKPLDVVLDLLKNLALDCRQRDYVTGPTVENMISAMIKSQAHRPSAEDLYFFSRKILVEAQERLSAAKAPSFGGVHAAEYFQDAGPQMQRPAHFLPGDFGPRRHGTVSYSRQSGPRMGHISHGHPGYEYYSRSGDPRSPLIFQTPTRNRRRTTAPISTTYQHESDSEDQEWDVSPQSRSSEQRSASHYRALTFNPGPYGSLHGCPDDCLDLVPNSDLQGTTVANQTKLNSHRKNEHVTHTGSNLQSANGPFIRSVEAPRTPGLMSSPPNLSVDNALKWIDDRKRGREKPLPNNYVIDTINKGDHVCV